MTLSHTHSIIPNPGLVSVDYESGCAEVWCDDAGLISFVRVSLSSDLAASLPDYPAFLDHSWVSANGFIGTGEVLDKSVYLGEDRVNIPAGHGKK